MLVIAPLYHTSVRYRLYINNHFYVRDYMLANIRGTRTTSTHATNVQHIMLGLRRNHFSDLSLHDFFYLHILGEEKPHHKR